VRPIVLPNYVKLVETRHGISRNDRVGIYIDICIEFPY
jgi:hypothetical protein